MDIFDFWATRCLKTNMPYASGQNVVASFVPFQGKDRSLVLSESASQKTIVGPNTREPVVATSR